MKFYPGILLVEGKDDFHVVRNLWVARFPSDRAGDIVLCPETGSEFLIQDVGEGQAGGISRLLESLPLYFKQRPPTLERLGILIDADERPKRRWEEVKVYLHNAGYEPPPAPSVDGIVLEHPLGHRPRVGIWLMPDNRLPGMLEDFVRWLIPENDVLHPKADSVLDDIEREGLQRYTHRSKAFIHTWLAWQEDPGCPMGQAITAKVLEPHSPLADPFVAWLRRLFCVAS